MKYFIDDFKPMNRDEFMEYLGWMVEVDVKRQLRDTLNNQSLIFMGKAYGQAFVWKQLDPVGYELEEDAAVKRYVKRIVEDLEQKAEKEGTATTDYRLYEIKVEK